ncbi:MAG: EAL domain-containing protein (putative c-di-GMP-specific phosphodiesterase class I)/CheY-like chemotaxis protein [Paraglaciecola sp.]|jgi:EAL domain-containing protein (putative c-di-GMP-specific phosphodiesterase class I)/CheY-like chemotaxis protein/GGDEF domain-containing protein
MSQSIDTFMFAEEVEPSEVLPQKVWKVLSVEDNEEYQTALVYSLKSLILPPQTKIHILTANSAFAAAAMLNVHKDIGLILLDVVMEKDDSGLRLVTTIREELANALVRIVLLTGQAGFAPEKEVMKSLDIDEYWNKADLTLDKLQSIVSSNMRTWDYVSEIATARQGLQIVLDAARSINSRYELPSFTRTVLTEIGHIIGVDKGGLFCMGNSFESFEDARVITATGSLANLEGFTLFDEQLSDLSAILKKAITRKHHIIMPTQSVLYFETNDIDEKCYLIAVNSDHPITDAHISLLKVFSENISSGFTNIALLNHVTELAYTHIDLKIPNRNWLTREIQKMKPHEWLKTRLLMLEVKNFDEMKFTFGYRFIQNVLSHIYQYLGNTLPNGAQITLSGHRQFSILLDSDFDISSELIKKLTNNAIEVDGVTHASSCSLLDMRLDPTKKMSAARIISMAESALKQAILKNITYLQYSQKETDTINRRYRLMGELRTAIRDGNLSVMLQPKVCLTMGKVVGVESLARWQRDDGSFVPPDEFIALAETSGLVSALDCLIFEKSMQALKKLLELGYKLPLAFNASYYDLLHPDYFNFISRCLVNYAIPPELIELEITETQAISDYQRIQHYLQDFATLGIKITIDDFGTGYSSLAHISNITAHCIKIDRTFVSKLETDKNSEHVIEMIVNLGKKFNFCIVAEGIETEYQRTLMSKIGCDIGQGYLFAKPMFTEDLIEWLIIYNKKLRQNHDAVIL